MASKDSLNSKRIVIIELYADRCPKTVANFLELCKGEMNNEKGEKLKYEKTSIFRVNKGAFIQGGDLRQLNLSIND